MRTRHKPPTLVSMWMLDVFCCALGCVTLLWLLNTREAGDNARQAEENARRAGAAAERLRLTESAYGQLSVRMAETAAELRARQTELLATRAELDQTRRQLNADLEDLRGKLVAMTAERDETAKKLALTQGDLAAAQAKQVAAAKRNQELDELLQRKQKEAKDLATRLTTTTQSAEDLAKLLRQKEREREELAVRARKAEDQLNDVDAKLKSVMKEAEGAKADLATLKKTGDELGAARSAMRDLQKRLDDANATIIDLQGQKAKLADRVDRLRVESESRFAGIAMTGRRVVFVVDTSGSMKLVREKVDAPQKWPTVIETIAKVMRSLPDLEKFQVVTFSRRADYLLGTGEWQTYQGETSVKQVTEALNRIDPAGDTNMYDALELAFRLRSGGLDTVYLFSDGLPTSGPGLTPDEERKLTDVARSERLSRHIRTTLEMDWNRPAAGPRVRINSIGFFYESPEVGAFLWALSRDNDGSFVGMSRP